MKSWDDYLEFEKKHKENPVETRKFFKWVLDRYGQEIVSNRFESALEIGAGISGGYIGILDNIKRKTNLDILYGDIKIKAEEMDFSDEIFDLVIISNTLDHCEFPDLVAKQIYRVLKKEGLLFLFNYFDEDENHPHSYSNSSQILVLFPKMEVVKLDEMRKTKRGPFVVATLKK